MKDMTEVKTRFAELELQLVERGVVDIKFHIDHANVDGPLELARHMDAFLTAMLAGMCVPAGLIGDSVRGLEHLH